MNDKKENLKSAIDHTRKAMVEIDTAACILIQERALSNQVLDPLGEVYRLLEEANQKILKLKD